jgi:hypothetical protein
MFSQKQTSLTPALMGLVVAVGFLCISGQSLWIDEANSAIRAIQPTWNDFWKKNIHYAGSDLQMPGYMLSLWAWEKIFGHSEYALRAMNIPFFLASVFAALFALRETSHTRIIFTLLIIFSPMVWVYMDEARPYIFQIAGSTLLLIGLVNQGRLQSTQEKNLVFFCGGSLILCASSLIGVVFAFFFGLAFMVILLQQKALAQIFSSRGSLAIVATSFLMLLGLGAYYFWTLQVGSGASSAANTTFASIAFAAYELLGFTGFGPGRLELRSEGMNALPPFLPGLSALALITLLVAAIPFRSLLLKPPQKWILLIAILGTCSAITVVAVGIIKDFRIVGRHLMPLLPFVLLFLAWSLSTLWTSGRLWKKSLAMVYLGLLLTSSVSARIDDRFQKDDYRSAAKLAQSYLEQGKIVWWAADEPSALYYIPDAERHITSQTLYLAFGPRATPIELRKQPNLILLSKIDIYDQDRVILNYIRGNQLKKIAEIKSFLPYAAD